LLKRLTRERERQYLLKHIPSEADYMTRTDQERFYQFVRSNIDEPVRVYTFNDQPDSTGLYRSDEWGNFKQVYQTLSPLVKRAMRYLSTEHPDFYFALLVCHDLKVTVLEAEVSIEKTMAEADEVMHESERLLEQLAFQRSVDLNTRVN